MLPLSQKRTTSYLAPPLFYVAKKWQLKDRRFPIKKLSPELVSAIDVFLLQTKNNRTEVFIVGKIIPMFSSIEVHTQTHTPPHLTSTHPQRDSRLIRDTRFRDSRKPYSRLMTFTQSLPGILIFDIREYQFCSILMLYDTIKVHFFLKKTF